MNFIDIVLGLALGLSLLNGYQTGFILGILNLVRWVGSLLIGIRFYPYVADWLRRVAGWENSWVLPLAFVLTTLLASIVLFLISNEILKKVSPGTHNRRSNHLFGLVPGALNGVVNVAIVAVLLLAIPLPENLEGQVHNSKLTDYFASYTETAENALAPILEKATRRTLNNLTVEPESNQFIKLPFKINRYKPWPDLEAEMLQFVNKERQEQGLRPLAMDTALTRVARMHAADMFRRGYFSHYTPEGKDPFNCIRAARIHFLAAGENLALAPTLGMAHTGLTNSLGHRANIL